MNLLNKLSKLFYTKPTVERTCETCYKKQTMDCPNSKDCYDTVNKPYWFSKSINI